MPGSAAERPKHAGKVAGKVYVLDSFAILAWLQDEPGAETVQNLLENAQIGAATIHVSWMNMAEVYYVTRRRSTDVDPQLAADKVLELIENLPLHLDSISKSQAVAAAR